MVLLCAMGAASADDCQHEFALKDCTYDRYCSKCEQWITRNTAHSWGSWRSGTGPSHVRSCTNYQCEAVDGGAHTGGTATCTDKAICDGCNLPYGEVDPDNHDWDEWYSLGSDKDHGHGRRCTRDPRNHYEFEAHTGGNPTCNVSAICTTCDQAYVDVDNHGGNATTNWAPYEHDNTRHIKLCEGCKFVVDRAPHDYSTATCTTPATCPDCKATSGDVDKTNHTGGTEIRNQVDAGEFTEGYTGDTHCLGCGDKLADGQSIQAIRLQLCGNH